MHGQLLYSFKLKEGAHYFLATCLTSGSRHFPPTISLEEVSKDNIFSLTRLEGKIVNGKDPEPVLLHYLPPASLVGKKPAVDKEPAPAPAVLHHTPPALLAEVEWLLSLNEISALVTLSEINL